MKCFAHGMQVLTMSTTQQLVAKDVLTRSLQNLTMYSAHVCHKVINKLGIHMRIMCLSRKVVDQTYRVCHVLQ